MSRIADNLSPEGVAGRTGVIPSEPGYVPDFSGIDEYDGSAASGKYIFSAARNNESCPPCSSAANDDSLRFFSGGVEA